MEMKEKYVPAEMEIIKFEAEDVIRTSINAATEMVEQDVDYETYFA